MPSKEATWYLIVRHRERLLMLESVPFNSTHVLISQRMGIRFSVSIFCSMLFTYSMVTIQNLLYEYVSQKKMSCKACLTLLGKISSISSHVNNQLVKERTFMPFLLKTLTQSQIWKVQKKCKWLAKCTNSRCRKIINVGIECIVIAGALMIPFNTNKAVAQKFYYCLHALCVTNWLPWTNIWPLLEFTFDNHITDDRKKEIFSLLNI